jgi:hypothetical protein
MSAKPSPVFRRDRGRHEFDRALAIVRSSCSYLATPREQHIGIHVMPPRDKRSRSCRIRLRHNPPLLFHRPTSGDAADLRQSRLPQPRPIPTAALRVHYLFVDAIIVSHATKLPGSTSPGPGDTRRFSAEGYVRSVISGSHWCRGGV